MRWSWMGLLTLLACATVRQTYHFEPDVDPGEAAFSTAETLGFNPEVTDAGVLLTMPESRMGGKPMLMRSAPGRLEIEGTAVSLRFNEDALGQSPRVFVAAVHQKIAGLPDAPLREPSSEAPTVLIDVIAPWAGALFTSAVNPYAPSTLLRFWSRLATDICGAGIAIEYQFLPGQTPTGRLTMLGVGLALLAVGRVTAVIDDVSMLPFRQAFAKAGFSVPDPLPAAETTN